MKGIKVSVDIKDDSLKVAPVFGKLEPKTTNLIVTENGEYTPPEDIDGFDHVSVNVSTGGCTLEELTITENGTYTPQEGVDGFSKVVARVVPKEKVKVSALNVNSACINEDGIWGGERLIDTSECTTLSDAFLKNSAIKSIDASGWNTSKVTSLYRTLYLCNNLTTIDVTGWDVSNVTNFSYVFTIYISGTYRKIIGYEDWEVSKGTTFNNTLNYTRGMDVLDLRKWEIPNATSITNFFPEYLLIKSLVGGEGLESVIANSTTILKGLKVGFTSSNRFYIDDRASLRALINGLADLTGQATQTIGLNRQITTGQTTSAFDTLTEEDIAIAVAKNWTITSVG